MNKKQWAEMAKGLADKGAKASGFEITKKEGDSIYYQLTITVGRDEPLHLTAKGTIKDGNLARIEPLDPAEYSTLVRRSK